MEIIIKKFGGSSVGSVDRIKKVARMIVSSKKKNQGLVVVVSAMGDTTDRLIDMAYKVNPYPDARELDMLLSTGEQVSISLLAMAILNLGNSVVSLTGPQVGIYTDKIHKRARIVEVKTTRIMKELHKNKIVIVAGFQGVNQNNDITTLGRGGSDTTAVALAAALNAKKCEIYTDVDGVYSGDPRMIENAYKLKEISYDEMLEMASLGAKVLHPRAVELAKQYNVKLEVKSSFSDERGTEVKGVDEMEGVLRVSGVTCDKKIAKIAILKVPDKPGVAYKVFNNLSKANIYVDMIIQSIRHDNVNDISFTVPEDDLDETIAIMEKTADELGAEGIVYDKHVAKVSIIGAGMGNKSRVAMKMFQALAEEGINIQMISTSEIKISCLIDLNSAEKAMKAIHNKFLVNGIEIVKKQSVV